MNIQKTFIVSLLVLLILLLFNAFFMVNKNLDTLYDEGFLFLSIQNSSLGIIQGSSQWSMILNKLLGINICSSIMYLRYCGLVLNIITTILFSLMIIIYFKRTNKILKKSSYILFFLSVFLFSSLSFGGIILSYNGLQQFFLLLELGLFFMLITSKSLIEKIVELFFIGYVSFLSMMTILPSGILVFFILMFLYCIFLFKEKKKQFKSLLYTILIVLCGFVTSILIFNICICNITDIFSEMNKTAHTIMTLNRGYDPVSFTINILLFFRDWVFVVVSLIGSFVLFNYVYKYNKYIACFFYCILILIFAYYQQKSKLTISMLMVLLIINPLLINDKYMSNIFYNYKKYFSFKYLLIIFLFLFPVIASIGTNVYLGLKIAYFIMPWSIILVEILSKLDIKKLEECFYSYVIIFILLLIPLSISCYSKEYNISKLVKVSCNSPIKGMYITNSQNIYFNKVKDVLEKYKFSPHDYIFSTQLDFMTIVDLKAYPVGLYFQPMDFLAVSKKDLHCPDYIFVSSYDISIAGDELKRLDWGWPNEFDKYYVGTPETKNTGYPTERWLYCRKSKRL